MKALVIHKRKYILAMKCVFRNIRGIKANFSIDYSYASIVKDLFLYTGYVTLNETRLSIFITLIPFKEVVNANVFHATGRLERGVISARIASDEVDYI